MRKLVTVSLVLAALVLGVPIGLIGFTIGRYELFAAHSADRDLPEIKAKVEIDLYLVPPYHLAEYERYLTLTTPGGSVRKKLSVDWGGAARTSLYLTADRNLVILGPAGDDYLLSLGSRRIAQNFRLDSSDWTYLGAFDFRRDGRDRVFRFLTAAESAECIPSMGDFPPGSHRSHAYQRRCRD